VRLPTAVGHGGRALPPPPRRNARCIVLKKKIFGLYIFANWSEKNVKKRENSRQCGILSDRFLFLLSMFFLCVCRSAGVKFFVKILKKILCENSQKKYFSVKRRPCCSHVHPSWPVGGLVASIAAWRTAPATRKDSVHKKLTAATPNWNIEHLPVQFSPCVYLHPVRLAVLFSQNKPANNNQPTVLSSQNEPAPAIISHQPNERVVCVHLLARYQKICTSQNGY
jgi:hypothetical protein